MHDATGKSIIESTGSASLTAADRYALKHMPEGWFGLRHITFLVRNQRWRCERLTEKGMLENRVVGKWPDTEPQWRKQPMIIDLNLTLATQATRTRKNTISTVCPRKRIVSATFRWDGNTRVWTLGLECGHTQERRHLPEYWKHPKTTQCGQCWRNATMGDRQLLGDVA